MKYVQRLSPGGRVKPEADAGRKIRILRKVERHIVSTSIER